MIDMMSWQTPTLSLRVLYGCSVHGTRNERVGVCYDRVGIIFLSGMWGSMWVFFTETTGSLRNLETRRTPSIVGSHMIQTLRIYHAVTSYNCRYKMKRSPVFLDIIYQDLREHVKKLAFLA